jgi:hypothetical protein
MLDFILVEFQFIKGSNFRIGTLWFAPSAFLNLRVDKLSEVLPQEVHSPLTLDLYGKIVDYHHYLAFTHALMLLPLFFLLFQPLSPWNARFGKGAIGS